MITLKKTLVTEKHLLRLIQGLNCLENKGFDDIQFLRRELEIHYKLVQKRKIRIEIKTIEY